MNISGIRPSYGFYENDQIKFRPQINPMPTEEKVSSLDGPAASVEISEQGMLASKNQVAKAVSNMEQDTAIHRYQYFVQNKQAAGDTSVRGTENFSL